MIKKILYNLSDEAVLIKKINPLIKNSSILFAIFASCYAFELTNFNLSIDEEVFAFQTTDWELLGRWALQFITIFLWPIPSLPFGPVFIFGILGSISFLIILRAFDINNPEPLHFLTYPVFISFPIWFEQIEYSGNTVGNGVALLMSSLSLIQTKKLIFFHKVIDRQSLIFAIGYICMPLVFAMGIYQSHVFVYTVLSAGLMLSGFCKSKFTTKQLFFNIIFVYSVTFFSIIIYLCISKLILNVMNEKPNEYAVHFVNLGDLFLQPLNFSLKLVKNIAGAYVLYWWKAYKISGIIFSSVFLIGTAIILTVKCGINNSHNFAVKIICLLLIFISPFWLCFVTGGNLPARSFLAIPSVVWLFLTMPIIVSNFRFKQGIVFALSVSCFISIIYLQSLVQARAWTIQQQDKLLASALNEKINSVLKSDDDRQIIKVQFYGIHPVSGTPYPLVSSQATSGVSFFEFANGVPSRMIKFMNIIGFGNLLLASKEECISIKSEFNNMPSWPRPGSVKLINNIVAVKLSRNDSKVDPCISR